MFKKIIKDGCIDWGIEIKDDAINRMERFMELLIEKNRVMNLTAVTEPEEIARRHMLDCLFLLTCGDFEGKRVLDIGSGAGFPSVPLKCALPDLDITPLDSTAKRMTFIAESCSEMGLVIEPVAARAEEYITKPNMRESFDIVTSRAVAPLNILAELCLPYVKVGGLFLPMKSMGESADAELVNARKAIELLGGKLERARMCHIDGMDSQHQVLVIKKVKSSPAKYPRRFAKISATPL